MIFWLKRSPKDKRTTDLGIAPIISLLKTHTKVKYLTENGIEFIIS